MGEADGEDVAGEGRYTGMVTMCKNIREKIMEIIGDDEMTSREIWDRVGDRRWQGIGKISQLLGSMPEIERAGWAWIGGLPNYRVRLWRRRGMRIGMYNLEPHVVNVAMMKVSQYHKSRDDIVERYNHFFPDSYDKIYAFSIFDFTDKSYVTDKMICGGSGFDNYRSDPPIISKLPDEIESCDYDWSLYPRCDYSLIWFSHGCIRNCPFCIVRKKEGIINPCKPKNLNPNGKYIKIQDNNFFASPVWREAIDQLREWNQPCDFAGGIDARLMDEEMCLSLNDLKHCKQIKMAWDNPKDDLIPKFKKIIKYIKPYKIMAYVLIGYWSDEEQDIYRMEQLREMGIDPFVMPYDKTNYYQHHFARYVNHKAVFKSHTWTQYQEKYMKRGWRK